MFLVQIFRIYRTHPIYKSLFVDDTKLVASGPDLVSSVNHVNSEFQKIIYFFRSHKLSIHPAKTKFILFTNSILPKQQKIEIFINNKNFGDYNPNLKFPIEQVSLSSEVPAIKFLGIHIDPQLNFKYHISQLNSKISKALYFLRNSKNLLTIKG